MQQQFYAAAKNWYQQQSQHFILQLKRLQYLHNHNASLNIFTGQFQQVRHSFKRLEMLVAYFDEPQYKNLNSRLLPELELDKGTYEHVEEPHGLQVIESLLEDSLEFIKAYPAVQYEINHAIQTAAFLQTHPFTKPYCDSAIVEAVSRQLLRIAAMGITGFDKPVLDDALAECKASLQGCMIC